MKNEIIFAHLNSEIFEADTIFTAIHIIKRKIKKKYIVNEKKF